MSNAGQDTHDHEKAVALDRVRDYLQDIVDDPHGYPTVSVFLSPSIVYDIETIGDLLQDTELGQQLHKYRHSHVLLADLDELRELIGDLANKLYWL